MHSSTTTIFIIIVVSVAISTCYSLEDEQYYTCLRNFSCGPNIQNVSYPFWGVDLWGVDRPRYCGLPSFELKCQNNEDPTMEIDDWALRVLEINQSIQKITMARSDLLSDYCAPDLHNTTLDNNLYLRNGPLNRNLSIIYNCTSEVPKDFSNFICGGGVAESHGIYVDESVLIEREISQLPCGQNIQVPVWMTVDEILERSLTLQKLLNRGFEVYVANEIVIACAKCKDSGGICGSNSNEFACHCRDGTDPVTCQNSGRGWNVKLKLAVGFGASVLTLLLMGTVLIVKKFTQSESIFFWKTKTENYRNIEAFLKNCGSLSPKRFTYSDIKKITNCFRTKLGQGGFGCVYKGRLENGHLVAVKVLKGLKGNGDDFINEVATISRTSHVHIVTLLGFCFDGSHRALIYEFMPNGSLDKFIHDGSLAYRQLGWEAFHQIAVGIARGLEYLHRGCNARILHFDIKPHNILLDDDFSPKISDFGLAKLCPQKESIISLLVARGTPGYIAPEVFSRNFGEVSHKSDVYSYGMMVLEMVGGRKNISVEVDHTSEIYFPHWIYKRLELDEELGLLGTMGDEANASARKMIIVGLWCIQTNPSHRPSISRVLEMLEVSLESLQVPPKPFLSSPSRAPVDSSITTHVMTL